MFFLMLGSVAEANPCDGLKYREGTVEYLAPGSVPNDYLDDHLNASMYSHDIKFDILQHGGDLQVDIIEYPGAKPIAAGLFTLLQISRLAQDDFERLVLVEEEVELFFFDGKVARENGCQALWGPTASGSPMPLFVGMMGAAQDSSGELLIPYYNGNWLNDMNLAMATFNEVIAPEWIFSAAQ